VTLRASLRYPARADAERHARAVVLERVGLAA
jgi:hypothetical protein